MSDAPSFRVFDTHCHLSYRGLCGRAEEVVRRARGVGVAGMLTLGTTVEDSRVCVDLARRFGPVTPHSRACCWLRTPTPRERVTNTWLVKNRLS